jgi:hypothetical protein
MEVKVAVGTAVCVSASSVPAMARAVSMTCVGCVLGVDRKLLQEVSSAKARRNDVAALLVLFTFPLPFHTLRRRAQRHALPIA